MGPGLSEPRLGGPDAEIRRRGFHMVCGVDEVGRGPLAGPVVAAAVLFDRDLQIRGLRDSKKLSATARRRLVPEIRGLAVGTAIGVAEAEEIDRINILQASLLAMTRAVRALPIPPEYVLVDGNHPIPCSLPQSSLVGGDGRSVAVAAASVLAKEHRDELMVQYGRRYPGYGFEAHMGYPTAQHRDALRTMGVTPIHRRTFKGVAGLAPPAQSDQPELPLGASG